LEASPSSKEGLYVKGVAGPFGVDVLAAFHAFFNLFGSLVTESIRSFYPLHEYEFQGGCTSLCFCKFTMYVSALEPFKDAS
jgi:hypothetical protein